MFAVTEAQLEAWRKGCELVQSWPLVDPCQARWSVHSVYRFNRLHADAGLRWQAERMRLYDVDVIPCARCGRMDGAADSFICMDCGWRYHRQCRGAGVDPVVSAAVRG